MTNARLLFTEPAKEIAELCLVPPAGIEDFLPFPESVRP